jgi:hypothetical protein
MGPQHDAAENAVGSYPAGRGGADLKQSFFET